MPTLDASIVNFLQSLALDCSTAMAAAQLDVGQLSTFCSVPEASITTLLDKPTAELVRSLLENVAARAQEFNGLKAEKLRVDVELESAVRGGDSKTRALKASVDRAQKQSSDLKQKLQLEGIV